MDWTATVAAAALCLTCAATAQGQLANPSFEDGDRTPAGWEFNEPAGTQVVRDTTVIRTGAASLRITSDAEGAAGYPAAKFPLRGVSPGEEYQATAWVCTRDITDIGGYLVLEFDRGDERLSFVSSAFTMGGTRDWLQLQVRAMAPPEADTLRVCVVAHGQGTAWFDDVALTRTREVPADPLTGSAAALTLDPAGPLGQPFLGFGAQGDYFLTRACNTGHGVDDRDRALILRRVEEMRPHIIRTFFDYQWWAPEEGRPTPDSEAMRDYVGWLRFLQSIGTQVLLTPWGDVFAYPAWMGGSAASRLPAPEKRAAMVRSLTDLVAYLVRDQALSNVRYLSLMNEPENDPLRAPEATEYVRLCRLLDQSLRDRGLREGLTLLAADECTGPMLEPGDWFRQVSALGLEYADAWSSHTYQHSYAPSLQPWISTRRAALAGAGSAMPLMVTEFGYGGATFDNPENGKYEYGLFLADFAVTALRSGASAALTWCLMDTYYNDVAQQHWGLWTYRDTGWAPRPGFYSWSLLTRYTRPGSQIVPLLAEPAARDLHALALRSPAGELTVLLVNRYTRPLEVTLRLPDAGSPVLRRYAYTADAIPVPGGGMIGASGVLRPSPGTPATTSLPARSFVLLTNVGAGGEP
jgi:hypothetical protein